MDPHPLLLLHARSNGAYLEAAAAHVQLAPDRRRPFDEMRKELVAANSAVSDFFFDLESDAFERMPTVAETDELTRLVSVVERAAGRMREAIDQAPL